MKKKGNKIQEFYYLKKGICRLRFILTDHNKLSSILFIKKIFENDVEEIIDHHQDEGFHQQCIGLLKNVYIFIKNYY